MPLRLLGELIAESESGRLTQADADRRLPALMTSTGPLTRTTAEAVFSAIRLRPSAASVIRRFQHAGLRVGLVSASFDTYVEHIAARLDVTDWYSNVQLRFDGTRALASVGFTIDAASLKHRQLHHFCERHGPDPHRVLAVGDSRYDLQMFACTGHGVLLACPHNDHLREHAWQVITRIDELTDLAAPTTPVRPAASPAPRTARER